MPANSSAASPGTDILTAHERGTASREVLLNLLTAARLEIRLLMEQQRHLAAPQELAALRAENDGLKATCAQLATELMQARDQRQVHPGLRYDDWAPEFGGIPAGRTPKETER